MSAGVVWLLLLALLSQTAPPSFDAEYARLKQGRDYSRSVPTGALKKRHGQFQYWLVVPSDYDPAKRWQVRFQLHGGVMRDDDSLRGDGSVRLAGDDQIYVMPSGWRDAPWWTDQQVASLHVILEDIKRDYNVDENRVFLSGVSDGATGLYYVATHDTTPYAAYLPLNGFYLVLRSPELELRNAIFLNNLRDKPFFIVNGGLDPLYPINLVEPSIAHLNQGGVRITYAPQPDAGHDTSWWPTVRDSFESFVRSHPRVALPDTLSWEVSETRTWNRAHWLVIDSLGATPGDTMNLPDLNVSSGNQIFHNGKSGRADLVRTGNIVTIKSHGVKELTLLVSPDQFDLDRNITVVVNGRTVFDARVEKSVTTLTRWAARDNDRTMLFAAEIKIKP
jgi:acetyl esterase/lipase